MNVELLRNIAAVIQEKPAEFNMNSWHHAEDPNYDYYGIALCDLPKDKQISCDTTHCIAGWAQVLSPDRDCKVRASVDAKRLLQLDDEQADRLFYVEKDCGDTDGWPKRFRGRKKKGMDELESAWSMTPRQAAARIEHFIATGGTE